MRVIRNRWLPARGFKAVNLFGYIFIRRDAILSAETLRHESIHMAQIKEMLYAGFYIWYVIEWLIRLAQRRGNAYRRISLEREAYENQGLLRYEQNRRHYAWRRFLTNG